VGAESVIHGGDLRHRWTVVVGMITGCGGMTALFDVPTVGGVAWTGLMRCAVLGQAKSLIPTVTVLTAHTGPATAIHSVAIRRGTTMPSTAAAFCDV
jgi:hypothetical protein